MWTLGFGIERVAWLALKWPRATGVVAVLVALVAVFGASKVRFDEDLRGVFSGNTQAYRDYVWVTDHFVDPENEMLLLVEGKTIGNPAVLAKLMDLQFELQLLDGVESVYSAFALRGAPDAEGDSTPIITDASAGLTPALIERIRTHPLLGERLLSADASMMLYVVTPTEKKAGVAAVRALDAEIEKAALAKLSGTGVTATITGFPAIRASILEIMARDQIVLNLAGAIIGFVMCLIVFRSFIASVMTAGPAIIAGTVVAGGAGLLGIPLTAMSNVIPALVMIVGFADGIHLSYSWRHRRDHGDTPLAAEWVAQREVGAACVLTAITTSVSFLSLTISDVTVVKSFGWIGAVGMFVGVVVVLVTHALLAQAIGRFWRRRMGGTPDLFSPLARPSALLTGFAVRHARAVALLVAGFLVVVVTAYIHMPPEHSIREHLPKDNPANAALGRIDKTFGGAFPLQIVVPLHGAAPTSPEGLARIKAVHEAGAGVEGFEEPLSLWSLVKWIGGDADAETGKRLDAMFLDLPPSAQARFLSDTGATLISGTLRDAPTHELEPIIERIEAAAHKAGGQDIVITGVTALTTREGARTINNLNGSLTLAIFADLAIMMIAFRNWSIGFLAVFSNTVPVLATCAVLVLFGKGMQFSTVIALTVAFGVTVDETTHFLNRFVNGERRQGSVGERLIATAGHMGPVIIGTTIIILAGLSTTLTSGLPTVSLFGMVTGAALCFALIGDLVVLPALIAGPARRLFEKKPAPDGKVSDAVRSEAV
ncbi:MAG TPA: MMPL family transporter [Bauldia sp.]|nr:MMPL family transporter [Bauldia sp.]